MKARLIALIACMLLLPLPVVAAPWNFVPAAQGQGQQLKPHQPAQTERREARRERRLVPERGERPRQRLTEDERHNLRRDIDQADREIYRRDRKR